MYRPTKKTADKLKKLERSAKRVIKAGREKLDKQLEFNFQSVGNFGSSEEVRRYVKALERFTTENKIKKIKGYKGREYYATESEIKAYKGGYEKTIEKARRMEVSLDRIAKKNKMRVGNIFSIRNELKIDVRGLGKLKKRSDFVEELNLIKDFNRGDYYKNRVENYKKNIVAAINNTLMEVSGGYYEDEVKTLMELIKERVNTMNYKTFYIKYMSGELDQKIIDNIYEIVRLMKAGYLTQAKDLTERILESLE